jgi:hypothetical protein
MRSLLLSFVLCILFAVACYGQCDLSGFQGGKFTRCQTLSTNYDLYWSIQDNDLHIGINLHGTEYQNGWVGFGISKNGGMRGADISVARYAGGKWVLEDRFVPGLESEPKLDDHQDVKLISASSSASSTVILFTRPVKACDVLEDHSVEVNGTAVIFAFGQNFGYHGMNRGQATVWFHGEPKEMPVPSDAVDLDVMVPLNTIPNKDTTYLCAGITLPSDQKYHVIKWRPKINPDTAQFVHHILLYICPAPQNVTPWECGMAPAMCAQAMIAWSVGQDGNDFYGDYGLPIGAGTTRYIVIQMHYNNPELIAGVQDASGITLTYTPTLRTHDLGSMIVATIVNGLQIPPGQFYERWAECPSECTNKFPTNITMINYFPHMHTIGNKIWMQQIRNGVELPEIHRDDHYDFLRQQTYQVETTIMPGDRLRLHCIWNSTGRTNITYGGESTSTEMCAAFFLYYPAYRGYSTCSNFGQMTLANCNSSYAMLPVAPLNYSYTALPPVQSTCPPDSSSSAATLVSQICMIVLSVLSLVL